jgi:hypothetical protein
MVFGVAGTRDCKVPTTMAKAKRRITFMEPLMRNFRRAIALTMLNYSRSRNPTRVRAHTQRHIQAPREPLNLGVCLRVCDLSQYRT